MPHYDTESSSDEEDLLMPAESSEVITTSVQQVTKSYPDPDENLSLSSIITDAEDNYSIIYIIFFIQGIGMLLPWNFFITAKTYFQYKLQTSESLQNKFENAVALAAMFSSLISSFINVLLASRLSRNFKVISCLLIMFASFFTTSVLVEINSLSWPDKFFAITITIIVLVNFASGIYQGTLFGIAGIIGMRYTQALMGGQSIAGIFAALADLFSKLADKHDKNPKFSALIYFIIAAVVIAVTAITYMILVKMPKMKFHFRKFNRQEQKGKLQKKDVPETDIPYIQILFKIKWVAFSVMTVFAVTLTVFPALLARVESVDKKNGSRLTNDLFSSLVCFLLFNVGDWTGRTLAGQIQICDAKGPWLPLLSLSRILFVPLFLMCNVPTSKTQIPFILKHDFWPIILNVFFSLSNGYLGSLCMMSGPKLVKIEYAEIAGTMMSLFLSAGLTLGSVVSFAI